MIEPEPLVAGPRWLEWLQMAGLASGAIVSIALFVRGFRAWAYRTLWLPVRQKFVTRADVVMHLDTRLGEVLLRLQELVDAAAIAAASRARLEEALHEMAKSLRLTKAILWQFADSDETLGWYECDLDGLNIRSSRTLLNWFRCSAHQFSGHGWINYIAAADRDRALSDWAHAVKFRTSLYTKLRMGPLGGPYLPYEIYVQPIPEAPPPLGFSGWLRPELPDNEGHDPRVSRAFPES